MPAKPRVFISSTIADFQDLRTALRYWLEESGFEVLLSELNDFPVESEKSAVDNCLQAIESCGHFLLLIGFRSGSFYSKPKGVTVTRAEYRKAYSLLQESRIKLLVFLRQETSQALKANNTAFFDSPESFDLVKGFVEEVRKDSEVNEAGLGGSAFPIGNWLFRFQDFEDIWEAASRHFRLGKRLRAKAIQANLEWELEKNLAHMFNKSEKGIAPEYLSLVPLYQELRIDSEHLTSFVELSGKHLDRLAYAAVFLFTFNPVWLSTVVLEEALNSGEFLDYDKKQDVFMVGETQRHMLSLLEAITRLKDQLAEKTREAAFAEILEARRSGETCIKCLHLALALGLTARFQDAFGLSASLLAYFRGITQCLVKLPSAPLSPFPKSAERLAAEAVTSSEINELLKSYFGGQSHA